MVKCMAPVLGTKALVRCYEPLGHPGDGRTLATTDVMGFVDCVHGDLQ